MDKKIKAPTANKGSLNNSSNNNDYYHIVAYLNNLTIQQFQEKTQSTMELGAIPSPETFETFLKQTANIKTKKICDLDTSTFLNTEHSIKTLITVIGEPDIYYPLTYTAEKNASHAVLVKFSKNLLSYHNPQSNKDYPSLMELTKQNKIKQIVKAHLFITKNKKVENTNVSTDIDDTEF